MSSCPGNLRILSSRRCTCRRPPSTATRRRICASGSSSTGWSGVERFFLYDNGSTDDHSRCSLPTSRRDRDPARLDGFPPQLPAYGRMPGGASVTNRAGSRSSTSTSSSSLPTALPSPRCLADYERWPGVGVNWAIFGPSGHRSRPDGLVIENYISARGFMAGTGRTIKSIVDPRRVVDMTTPHHFVYTDGSAVDENHYPIRAPPPRTPPWRAFGSTTTTRSRKKSFARSMRCCGRTPVIRGLTPSRC